jgi:hypothetical protein
MCTPRRSIRKAMLAALGLALFASAIPVFAQDSGPQDDPPDRVARLSYLRGDVSFQPAGDDNWVAASLNRPLGTGDKLFTDQNSRVEMEVGAATLRLDAQSNFDILNLNDTVAQTELTQGTMNLHVRRVFEGQSYEVDTPNLAFVINQPGDYRVDIAPDGTSTMVTVFKGAGDVYGENNASYSVNAGNSYRFHDASLQDYEVLDIPRGDDFDTWADSRNQRYDRPASRQYVSEEVIGAADLDDYGGWSDVPEYGHVWYPTQVEAGWAPYRYGHWAWVDPWGWTWVDNAAWGFAPFHYGRWVYAGSRWGWCPGPVAVRPVYAPALVAFVGGAGFGIGVSTGPVGWFPLGPRDVYVPWYHASRNYFTNVNVRNTTIINNTYITNVYNDYSRGRPLTNMNYAYRQNVGAVTAVPRAAFVGARQVNAARVQVNAAQLRNANVATRVRIAPTRQSFVAANAQRARVTPSAQVANRNVIARTAPPPKPAPVDRRIAAIEKNNSQPLATRELRKIGTPVAVGAAAGAGAAAIANRGGKPRVQVVGQNAPKPQPIPARAPGVQGNRVQPGQAANANNAKPGTVTNPNVRTLPAQTGTPDRGKPQDRTVTRGNANEGKGNPAGNPNANGLPSSRFAPHAGPQGQPQRTTGATSTPRGNAVTPNDKTPNNPRQVTERNANSGRTIQTPPSGAGNPSRNVQKTPPTVTNERPQTVHRAPPPQNVQKAPPSTQQERNIERRTTTPPTSQQRSVESRTIQPKRSVEPQPQRQYTPRTAPVEHAPPQQQVQRAPQPQVQHAPQQVQRQAPQQVQRQAPPDRRTPAEKKKDKDEENGHR